MHREIVLSNAYRMSSVGERARRATVDPDNRLLSHMPVKRLEGEAIRDAILAASGSLDLTDVRSQRAAAHQPLSGRAREAGVGPARRSGPAQRLPRGAAQLHHAAVSGVRLSAAFDHGRAAQRLHGPLAGADADEQRVRRRRGVQVGGARLERDTRTASARLDNMFLRAYGRLPDATDRAQVAEFLDQQAARYPGATAEDARVWADLAHVIFNSKEFIFVR